MNAEHAVIVIVIVDVDVDVDADNDPMHNNNIISKRNGIEDFIMAVFVTTTAGIVVTLSSLLLLFGLCLWLTLIKDCVPPEQ